MLYDKEMYSLRDKILEEHKQSLKEAKLKGTKKEVAVEPSKVKKTKKRR